MSDLAALADELERARNEHLNSFGGSPRDVRRARYKLRQLLWDDQMTIIIALRKASEISDADRSQIKFSGSVSPLAIPAKAEAEAEAEAVQPNMGMT